jgi:hypothetical protein
MEVERFVAELSHLSKRHGIRHFELVDQCIAPGYMEKMCDAILAAGLDVCWFCNARTEPGFTPELFRKMRAAGATMVMWGVESGSPRLLRLMKKGVPAKSRLEILRAASDAGLFNFAYVFFGFPTETAAEAEATIALIEGNTGVIHAYGKSVFTLGKHSPLMTRPGENGILAWIEDSQELSTNLSYETSSGLGAAEMSGVLAECQDRCRRAYGDPLWMALRTREALHLYLAHHGRDYVRSYKVGCEERDFVF